ncbi:MAG TPA: hypothetical protein PK904_13270 [Bacteroidales bacterium]|nr:hypothetical protein [Bacteroidales bacterium]
MKKLFLLGSFILFAFALYAGTKKVEGYIITNQGDTIYGKIRIKTDKEGRLEHAKLQDKLVFYNNDGVRKIYLPGSISSFYFYYDFQTPAFVSVNFYKDSHLFLMVIGDQGYLKLYKYYPSSDKSLSSAFELAEYVYGVNDFEERFFFYIIKPDGKKILMGKHTPQNKLIEFFSDNDEIAEKLRSREYNYADVYKMVREYNQWKATSSGQKGKHN